MTLASDRFQFVSPAGQKLDVYGVVADDGVNVKLVNEKTRGHARVSHAWLSQRPCIGRAHWVEVGAMSAAELGEERDQ